LLTQHQFCIFLALAFFIWVDEVPEQLKSFVIDFKLLWLLFCIFIVFFGSSILLGTVGRRVGSGGEAWVIFAVLLLSSTSFLAFPFVAHVFVCLVNVLICI